MTIFTRYVEDLANLVPVVLRRKADNVLNLLINLGYEALDAQGEALEEMADTSWPLTTASGWVLDEHWGPYHDLQRNGQTDADFRTYIRAKRLLNRSWGSADQALTIFALLLPTADLSFTPWYPKAWTIGITGVDMATAAPAVLFMTKKPSPQGGGFSVCGDNGQAVISDPVVFTYNSIYGVNPPSVGWYSSIYGASGGAEAGWAHVAGI